MTAVAAGTPQLLALAATVAWAARNHWWLEAAAEADAAGDLPTAVVPA